MGFSVRAVLLARGLTLRLRVTSISRGVFDFHRRRPSSERLPARQRPHWVAPRFREARVSRTIILWATALLVLIGCVGGAFASDEEDVIFSFAILSDRTGGHVPGVYPRVIEAINAREPDLVVTVGDHIEGYGEDYARAHAEWDSVLAMLRMIEAPVHMTPGNHDIWDDESEKIYVDRTGRDPFYSFDHENTHFVILDNSRINTWARMGLSQASWLMNDLTNAQADNIFVFFHKPLWDRTLRRGKDDNLHAMLVDHSVDAVFCGHYHHYFAAEYEGIDYTTIGSSGGGFDQSAPQPELRGLFFQFAMVDVTSDGYELTVHNVDTGETYPRDFVTVDLLDEIAMIEDDLVGVSEFIVTEKRAPLDVTISIENVRDRSLDGRAEWDVPEQWDVSPASLGYSIPPGDASDLECTASRSGAIYPAPSVSLEYPLSDGRLLEVRKPARIVRRVDAPLVSESLSLDGEVDAFIGERGAVVEELYQAEGYEPVSDRTRFHFAHDGENLLVTAVCEESEMDELVASASERDGAVYMDDCVGLFIQPDTEELVVYQIYVNPEGAIFDQKITFDESMWYTTYPEWNGDYGVATSRDDDRWIAEIVIPFETLEVEGGSAPGEPAFSTLAGAVEDDVFWGLNFRRKQPRASAAVNWQVPLDYDPGTFGRIVLE
ncbi:MAG: hypothetical protein GF400_11600 [Candidatus Eisenbacteria bacterium]|nr:hypothetical protein [Candidatus Eisenbacteria bacterium]